MQNIRIAFVGAGKQAQTAHLRHYTTLPDCDVIALCDRDTALAERVAARYGIGNTYGSVEDLLAAESPDGLVVTFPPKPSAEATIQQLLEQGIPMIVEKPLAGTPGSSRRIVEAVRKTGAKLWVGFHKRSDPATLHAITEINRLRKSGELGKLTYARVQCCLSGDWVANGYRGTIGGDLPFPNESRDEADYEGMKQDARKIFGMFSSGYGHQFDWLRALLGEPLHFRHTDPSGVVLSVESESGIPAIFECSPYRTTHQWVENAMVCFENGYLRIDLPPPLVVHQAGKLEIYRDGGKEGDSESRHPVFPHDCAMYCQAQQFVAALKGEPTTLCPAEEAHETLLLAAEWANRVNSTAPMSRA